MVAEYLDHALHFERLAQLEENQELKAKLEKQAAAYRRLAAERTAATNYIPHAEPD